VVIFNNLGEFLAQFEKLKHNYYNCQNARWWKQKAGDEKIPSTVKYIVVFGTSGYNVKHY